MIFFGLFIIYINLSNQSSKNKSIKDIFVYI